MIGRLNGQRFVPVYSKTICTAGLPCGLNNSRKKWSEYIFLIRANNGFNLRPSPTIFGKIFGRDDCFHRHDLND